MHVFDNAWDFILPLLLPLLGNVTSETGGASDELFGSAINDRFNNLTVIPETYQKYYKRKILETFSWNEASVKVGQCPCVRMDDSSACIGYDSTIFATSLREAMFNFGRPAEIVNLYLGDLEQEHSAEAETADASSAFPATLKGVPPQPFRSEQFLPGFEIGSTLSSMVGCNEDWCKSCARKFLENLSAQTRQMTNRTEQETVLNEIYALEKEFGTSNVTNNFCPYLDQSWSLPNSNLVNSGESILSESARRDVPAEPRVPRISGIEMRRIQQAILGRSSSAKASRLITRSKRQVELVDNQFETVYKIDCKQRGDPVQKSSVFLNLCNHCWEWGYLPEKFYPRYVNMISCQKDTRCLSGWGTCGQRTRSVQVLQNTAAAGQPVNYKPYSLNIPVFCDCQVKAGSALHDFVKG